MAEKKKKMRLDKFLTEMNLGSRSQVKPMIQKGKVLVNGSPITRPEEKIDPDTDEIMYEGKRLCYLAQEYFMLHKPAGVLSASRDPRAETVVDLITDRQRQDLFPVGRLDKDTEGLLLITNDGALAHELLSPRRHVDKCYYVELDQPIEEHWMEVLQAGIDIGDEKPTLPCRLFWTKAQLQQETLPDSLWKDRTEALDLQHLLIVIQEGRYHQIKRMFEACGRTVCYLKRLSMGPLQLDPALPAGSSRRLTEQELQALKNRK